MENNSKKFIIILLIFVVAMCILAWIFSSKSAEKDEDVKDNNQQQEEKPNEDNEAVEVLSEEQAIALIDKYHTDRYLQYEEGFTEELKQYIAYTNSTKNQKKCEDVYDVTVNEFGDAEVKIDDKTYCCSENIEVISYEDLNASYKELFGSGQDMPKTNFQHFLTTYNYVEDIDSYAPVFTCNSGYTYPNYEIYDIRNIEVVEQQLVISVAYVELVDDWTEEEGDGYALYVADEKIRIKGENLLDQDGKLVQEEVDKIFENYGPELSTYKYVFEKQNGKYSLVEFQGLEESE